MRLARYLNIAFIATVLTAVSSKPAYTQVFEILGKMKTLENNRISETRNISREQRVKMLSMIPEGETVQFEFPGYEEDEVEYFPLDTSGLHYIDLNFDGKLDLIYSSQSGNMGLTDSKVYMNRSGKLIYKSMMKGGLLHIEKEDEAFYCYTAWYTCCDSYTSFISKYKFSKTEFAEKVYSISIVGRRGISALPNFEQTQTIKVNDPELYAFPKDFYYTSPYFRDRNKNINDSLKAGHHIQMIKLKGEVQLHILYSEEKESEKWYLVLTEIIDTAPRSLYEWSIGDKRRFIGWIKP